MKPLVHMDQLTDREFAVYAQSVFYQGLVDGRKLFHPRTRDAVMLLIPYHPRRILHARKLRQVYGAGFDIAKAMRRIEAQSQESENEV